MRATALDEIPCDVRVAIDRTAFKAALQIGLSEAMQHYPNRLPILHISAHGTGEGMALSNGEFITWRELRDLLEPINRALNGFLIVCMSACKGYSACRMAMSEENSPLPYWVLVSNIGSPTWSDAAVGYSTLYHLLSRKKTIPDAVDAMIAASGDNNWVCETAHEAHQSWLDFVKQRVNLEAAGKEMEAVAEQQAPPDAKALELSAPAR